MAIPEDLHWKDEDFLMLRLGHGNRDGDWHGHWEGDSLPRKHALPWKARLPLDNVSLKRVNALPREDARRDDHICPALGVLFFAIH